MRIGTALFTLANTDFVTGSNLLRSQNPECPNIDESQTCENDCENANLSCILACDQG